MGGGDPRRELEVFYSRLRAVQNEINTLERKLNIRNQDYNKIVQRIEYLQKIIERNNRRR